MKVALYIAHCNHCNLKYFGKTLNFLTETALQKNYHGSGLRWSRHLKKHGDNVTMKLYGIFSTEPEDVDYIEPIARKFSEENNIVEDNKNWANIIPENGLAGGSNKGIAHTKKALEKISKACSGEKNGMYGRTHTPEVKKKLSDAAKGNTHWKGRTHSEESKEKIKSARANQVFSEETRRKMSESRSGEKNYMYGKTLSDEAKKKISDANKGKTPWNKGKKDKIVTCPHCDKSGGRCRMLAFHFDKCKSKSAPISIA